MTELFLPFFKGLKKTPDGSLFNPWFQQDKQHDISPIATKTRYNQLRAYLSERLHSAKYLFIAEALGYQGGHFTGIAMTSERILLGHHQSVHGIAASSVFNSLAPCRTSKPSINPKGMTEPTATIVWKAMATLGVDPYEVVLWNALAWHPYEPNKGLLSNRTPGKDELEKGIPVLRELLKQFPGCCKVAIGKKSETIMNRLGVDFTAVRHPAYGGAPRFRKQLAQLLKNDQ